MTEYKTSTVFLTSTNVSQNQAEYNTLTYNFSKSVVIKNAEITVSYGSLYYSWFNISASQFGNNLISYKWIDGITKDIVIPDGIYSISDIGGYIQFAMETNLDYLVDANGNPLYYLDLVENNIQQRATLETTIVPTYAQSISLGITKPVGATWAYPASPITPQLIVNNSIMGTLIGFDNGTYPTLPATSSVDINGQSVPAVSPQTSILIGCNMVNNMSFASANYGDIIYAFSPSVTPGSLQPIAPPQSFWYPCMDRDYNQFVIRFYDQNHKPLGIVDRDICIALTIRQKI